MPIHLPTIDSRFSLNRRRFLAGMATAPLAVQLALSSATADDEGKKDESHWALLSDLHINTDRNTKYRNVVMGDNLAQVVDEVAALKQRPAGTIITGDCAWMTGQAGNYATLLDLIKPLREAGPVHMLLGNHDRRDTFWQAIPGEDPAKRPVSDRHTTIVETPLANFFMLDSLVRTNLTPGTLGKPQLEWLTKELDARADKPALVFLHHNPNLTLPLPSGLTDTTQLFETLLPRRHVKAVLFGHSHNWFVTEREGLHLINLPPTAYVFHAARPNGWVSMRLTEASATFELSALDKEHAEHAKPVELKWRSS